MQLKRMIPNLLTAGNLVGGILAIILTLEGRIDFAPYCILLSALFDFLDGFAARLLKVQSELGKQLDSLADMVTFGVAPGVIVFELIRHYIFYNCSSLWLLSMPNEFGGGPLMDFPVQHLKFDLSLKTTQSPLCSENIELISYFAFFIPVFALFRLAKFNIDTRQTDQFIGLPTPAMTIFIASLPLMISDAFENTAFWKFEFGSEVLLNPFFLIGSSVFLSVLMVVELPLFALKFKHFKWSGNEIRYIFLTISIVLLATLFVWALPIIILLYIILSLINNLTKKQTKDEIQS